jgi:hypothetical protein
MAEWQHVLHWLLSVQPKTGRSLTKRKSNQGEINLLIEKL